MNGFGGLLKDFRYAFRVLRKNPLTSAVIVVALSLGIGVNVSSFVGLSAVVLHPLPYPKLESIVTVWETNVQNPSERYSFSPADFLDLKQQQRSFSHLAAFRSTTAVLSGGPNPQQVDECLVSADFFDVLGMAPEHGRTLSVTAPGNLEDRAVIVSDAFWKTRLAGSKSVLGHSIEIDRRRYTVVGIMPDEFDFPLQTAIWAPLTLDIPEQRDRAARTLGVIGLLKPKVSIEQAQAEVSSIADRLARQYPATNENRGMNSGLLRSDSDEVTKRFIITLTGAAVFVLLLACANVGSLQLARAINREREFAVRRAIGGTRWQVIRQLLAEGLVLSCAGAGVGLLLASWTTDLGKKEIPAIAFRLVPGLRTMHVDGTVFLLTAAASIVAGMLCTIPPAIQILSQHRRTDLTEALRGRAEGGGAVSSRGVLRQGLIVFELALAVVLLVGAGLMVDTFKRLVNLNQGFDPKNLLVVSIELPNYTYTTPARFRAFFDRALSETGQLHGVTAAAISNGEGTMADFEIAGRPEPRPGEPHPELISTSSQYLQAMRIPLVEGRFISDSDRSSSAPVAVLSQTLARHYWPHASPIGERIRFDNSGPWLRIVGVSGDVIEDWFHGTPAPRAYVSYAQFPNAEADLLLRTVRNPFAIAPSARSSLHSLDPALPMFGTETMESSQYEQRAGVLAAARNMTIYAIVAFLLAVTGIYAVVSYFVAARTREIGIRIALGASSGNVLTMTMRQAFFITAMGLAIGIPAALLMASVMSSALFNVVHFEPSTFALYGFVLGTASLIASFLPSQRAARIDPMVALREE